MRFRIPNSVAGIVLAGGGSQRMGVDKCMLDLGGRTLLQRAVDALDAVADEVVTVTGPGRTPPPVQSPGSLYHAVDSIADGGPLVGILAGLEATSAPAAVAVACDLPFVRPELLRLLLDRVGDGARFVVPVYEGQPQLLCSAWRGDAAPLLRARVEAGDRAVHSMLDALDAELVPPEVWREADPDGRSFVNVNTPEDLAEARASIEASEIT
ncbi:MAG: molybdenum cofactor guanylyltransferase [Chloroflexi bacterium]|nr:molybdenum cofactor guanylyltransferase [Chloroflexota bacterium]